MMPTPPPLSQENQTASATTGANAHRELEQSLDQLKESILHNVGMIHRMQDSIWRSMEIYSGKLGWGLTGIQPECWTLLDAAVDELVWRREQAKVLRQMANDWLSQMTNADLGEGEVVKNCARDVLKVLLR